MQRRDVLKHTALFFGYAVSVSALSETFVACSKEANLSWQPEFLTTNQANTVAEITETILPKTKTPGAKELGVPQFVDKMLKDLLSEDEQKDFLAGLDTFEKACKEANGKSFVDCTPEQRTDFLLKQDKEAAKLPPSVWGIRLAAPGPTAFFRRLKELTLLGYYTSEKVGKTLLGYDPLPGHYIACMPLAQVGKAWNE
ncbi:gluconate 2-dehydrogenase subunit 3 family protein [Spirosoma sp. HMF3257]|uniref:Gluconate 2-dehydrogenase subunit 3 family protein n=1 Tax=Spirosoma telluris TaxID=2183553 RepID=A0A327NRE0_9BACT|nr:gluconate 2-dehydrogenase subunit 3 family protein [Spirosoma telluris]RAI77817.1 gluconate 2-dehydrogenase subunit 3 family protein [Spirosoma telluris]